MAIPPGTPVRFSIEDGDRGPRACDVEILDAENATDFAGAHEVTTEPAGGHP
jgi:hypothetical protein